MDEEERSTRTFKVNVPKTVTLSLASENGFNPDKPVTASFILMGSSLCAAYNGRLIYSRQEAIKMIRWLNVGGWRWLSIISMGVMSLFVFTVGIFLAAFTKRQAAPDDYIQIALAFFLISLALAALGWQALAALRVRTMIQRLEVALSDLEPQNKTVAVGPTPLSGSWLAVCVLIAVALFNFGIAQIYNILLLL